MKIHVQRIAFLSALEAVKHVVPSKAHIAALEHVKVTADTADGGLSITGTDLDAYVRADVLGAHWPKGGTVLLPFADALAFLKASEAERLELEVTRWPTEPRAPMLDSAGAIVAPAIEEQCGRVKMSTDDGEAIELDTLPAEEWPTVPWTGEHNLAFTLGAASFRDALERVLPSAAIDVGRYAMRGALLEFNGSTDALDVVATDGRRCAIAPVDVARWIRNRDVPARSILPLDSAKLALKILPKKGEAYATLELDPTCALIVLSVGSSDAEAGTSGLGRVTMSARALDGEFPRYRAIVPAERAAVSVTACADELIKRIKVAAVGASDDAPAILLDVGEGDAVKIVGRSGARVSSADVKGAKVERVRKVELIACNPAFLADGIKACKADTVTIGWSSASAPFTVTAGRFVYVLMPVVIEKKGGK